MSLMQEAMLSMAKKLNATPQDASSEKKVDANGDPIVTYVDTKTKQDWNKFSDFLASPDALKLAKKLGIKPEIISDLKGNKTEKIQGSKILDTGAGNKMLREYIKTTPETSLKEEQLPSIVKEFNQYRDFVLNETEKFKKAGGQMDANGEVVKLGSYAPKGITKYSPENFMTWTAENAKTSHPEMVGQHLSSSKFPGAYIEQTSPNGENVVLLTEPVKPGMDEKQLNKLPGKAIIGAGGLNLGSKNAYEKMSIYNKLRQGNQ